MSNSLGPDQARRFVRPDLGPNCLPRLSADDTGRQRVNQVEYFAIILLISPSRQKVEVLIRPQASASSEYPQLLLLWRLPKKFINYHRNTHFNYDTIPGMVCKMSHIMRKTGLWGFRPGQTQNRLYGHRRWLEA